MSFLKRLLSGRSKKPASSLEPPPDRVAAVVAEVEARALPCVRIVGGEGGRSCLGGAPNIAGAWPRYAGRPLSVIAQLDLEEIRAAGGPDWLPHKGRLLFFYEIEYSGWGIDPGDLGCFAVRYEPDSGTPETPPEDLPDDGRWPEYPVTFIADISRPDPERLNVKWADLSGKEERELEAALEAMAPAEPAHHIGGYPDAVQNDGMELECQRMTSGVRFEATTSAEAIGSGGRKGEVPDWRLLLQLDTDNEAGMMWGDTGRLYFWGREQDARAGDFSRAWMILQCY
jgi:uncharacterized protein YwqG